MPSRHFILFVLPNGAERSRLGVTLSRKVGNAVARNRARRRLREAFRHAPAIRSIGVDIVVQAIPRITEATSVVLREEMAAAVDRYIRSRKDPSRRARRNRADREPSGDGTNGAGR